ncbi:hypothetical protein FGIG_03392 [Fasciola gigantica]|uniref:DUF4042 domain-containing protein n=1 Tax=Fasciola gigantica TaxID=46835 RepID=A0A504YE57_FASGI|nr:hypothetical protein FGIG_03392 [Fasciola gigantica]
MLRNAVLQLSECCEGVTYPEIMQDLSHLLAMYYRVAKSSNQKSCVDRSAFSKGKWKHDVTVCLTWDEAAKVYNWISKIICEGISQKKNDIPELGRFVSSLSSITTLFREVKLFPQSESGSCLNIQPYKEALNILLDQLRNLMLLFESGCSDAQSSYSTIFESFNKISHMVGNLVLGNLNQIDADVLTPLAEQLMRELQSRRTVLDPLQSVTIYATLSHLTYLHPVWDKLQESADVSNEASCQIHTTDILAPSSALYHSVLDALVDGLKRCDPYMLRTASQGSDEDRSTVIRQVVLSCLNGLAQLLLRRTSRSNTTNLTTVVRVLWTHVLTFGCQYGTNRRLNQAVVGHDGAASSSMSSGQSSPSSSLPTTSDEEGALKRSSGQCSKDRHQPNSRSYRNSSSCILASALVASGPLCSSSSEDERNTSGAWFGTTRSIACGLLAGSPGGTIPRTSHRQHLDASGFRGPHSRSHTSGFTNQLKPYALSVFCLKRLLEGCRSSSALDLWPTLMCGDGWAGMIPLSSTIRTVSNQSSSLYSETDRPNVALTPDLLTLVYKTSDMRIRKMLVEVLISLLAAVGKRFVIAEDLTPHSASFVPYSVRLAVELRHLHRRLMLALYGEKSVVLRGLLLKALTTLVLITPYPRLQPGLLTSLLPGLHQLLHLIESQNRMVDLRAGCLNLLGCILGRVPGPLMEVCQILSDDVSSTELNDPWTVIPHLRNTLSTYRTSCDHLSWSGQSRDGPRGPGCWFSLQSQDPFQPCWLVQVCLRLIHPDVSTFAWDAATQPAYPEVANFGGTVDQFTVGTGCQSTKQCQPPPVRVQALTVLRNMVPNYAVFLRPSLPLLKKTLLFCLQDYKKNKLLWAPTLKFLLVFLPYLQIVPTATNDPSTDTVSQGESLAWWCDFIPPIVGILRVSSIGMNKSESSNWLTSFEVLNLC